MDPEIPVEELATDTAAVPSVEQIEAAAEAAETVAAAEAEAACEVIEAQTAAECEVIEAQTAAATEVIAAAETQDDDKWQKVNETLTAVHGTLQLILQRLSAEMASAEMASEAMTSAETSTMLPAEKPAAAAAAENDAPMQERKEERGANALRWI